MDNRISLEHHIFEYSKKNKHNEDIPVYSVTNADGFCTEYFSKEVASKDKSTYKIVERGSFAYNPSRINVGSVDWLNCEDKVIVSPLYNVFKTSNEIDNDYLLFFLKSERCKFLIKAKASGSVRDNLKIDTLKQFTIPNISIDEQQRRSGNLKRIRKLIELNQTQLRNYENLIKSRFVEMFGTLKNTSFDVVKLGDYLSLITDYNSNGSYKTIADNVTLLTEKNYAYMVRTTDLENKNFDTDVIYVDQHAYDFLEKSKVYGGELIMNKIGSAGKVYIMPDIWMPTTLGMNQFLIRCSDNLLVKYLYYYLLTDDGSNEIYSRVNGAVTKTITKNAVRDINIIIPDISHQNQFVSFVEQVNKSKFDVQKSIYELQTLYDSLTQKYFG